MKIMTVLGTRPEIIRLSLIIRWLDQHADHVLVHTGQNYDDRLNGLFFRELGLREPDVCLDTRGTGFGDLRHGRETRGKRRERPAISRRGIESAALIACYCARHLHNRPPCHFAHLALRPEF